MKSLSSLMKRLRLEVGLRLALFFQPSGQRMVSESLESLDFKGFLASSQRWSLLRLGASDDKTFRSVGPSPYLPRGRTGAQFSTNRPLSKSGNNFRTQSP